jgi:hypothetical protein
MSKFNHNLSIYSVLSVAELFNPNNCKAVTTDPAFMTFSAVSNEIFEIPKILKSP